MMLQISCVLCKFEVSSEIIVIIILPHNLKSCEINVLTNKKKYVEINNAFVRWKIPNHVFPETFRSIAFLCNLK